MKCFTCVPASAVIYLLENGKLEHLGDFSEPEMTLQYLDVKDIQTRKTGKNYFNYPLFFTIKSETHPYLNQLECWEDVEWTIHFDVKEEDNSITYLTHNLDHIFLVEPIFKTEEETLDYEDSDKVMLGDELKDNWFNNLPMNQEEIQHAIKSGYMMEGVIDMIKSENVTIIQRTEDYINELKHRLNK